MEYIAEQIGADFAQKNGYTGKGIGIAFLDTGIFPHQDFLYPRSRIEEFIDLVNGRAGPYDDNGHGTHTCGIAVSAGKTEKGFLGIAPGAHVIMIKVLDCAGNGRQRSFLEGLHWIHHFHHQYQIRIVNISIGTPSCGPESRSRRLLYQVEQLWDDGLVVCVAGGNNGPGDYSITNPGNSRKIITVGSSNDNMKSRGFGNFHFGYSSRGPTPACVMKPDVVAPGTDIYSCALHNQRTLKSGTSMATPAVSGAIALLLEKEPWCTNKEVKVKLRSSCDRISQNKRQEGWGQINVPRLLNIK